MDSEGEPNMEVELPTKETPTVKEEKEQNMESEENLALETEGQPEVEPEANKNMQAGVEQAIESQDGEVQEQKMDEDGIPGLIPIKDTFEEIVQDLSPLADIKSLDEGPQQYLIKVFEDVSSVDEVTDGKLCISQLHGLLFEGSRNLRIPFKNVRWIDRCGCAKLSLEAFFDMTRVIILSYEDPETENISYIFFACDEITQDVLDRIHQSKLIQSERFDVDKHSTEVMEVLREQPMQGLAHVSLKVRPKEETMYGQGSDTKPMQCKMIMDLECISFFEGPCEKPTYQIKFWQEEGENVVELIKIMHQENEIRLETDQYIFVLTKSKELEKNLKQMSSRKKHFFTDVQNLVGLKSKQSSESAGMFPRPGPSLSASSLPEAGSFQGYEMGPLQIEREMDEALASLAGVEEFQVQWIALEADLNEIIQTGAIQVTEIQSGGLDPNDRDHLERALEDVASQLTEQRLDLALSRLKAARDLFTTSNKVVIKQIFMVDDLEILKKLYFRSLLQ